RKQLALEPGALGGRGLEVRGDNHVELRFQVRIIEECHASVPVMFSLAAGRGACPVPAAAGRPRRVRCAAWWRRSRPGARHANNVIPPPCAGPPANRPGRRPVGTAAPGEWPVRWARLAGPPARLPAGPTIDPGRLPAFAAPPS